MSEPEFPAELVERIALAAERHMFADYELPIADKWLHDNYCDLAIYLLRESGRNELVQALILARPYVNSAAHFNSDKRAQHVLTDIDVLLAKVVK